MAKVTIKDIAENELKVATKVKFATSIILNETANVDYDFDVNVYSTDPATAYSLLGQARELLKQNGWIIATRGYDVSSDEITHIGRGMEVMYLKAES